jgi:hypothetical protein
MSNAESLNQRRLFLRGRAAQDTHNKLIDLLISLCGKKSEHFMFLTCQFRQRPPLWCSGQTSCLQTEVPGSIPGATTFPEKQWVWNGVHSSLVRITEELPE